jgi:hypothetical protein
MKNIKTFESYHDGISYEVSEIELYVDYILSGNEAEEIFDTVGLDMPSEFEGDEYDSAMDEARELGIIHFMKYPSLINRRDMEEAMNR